MKLLTNNFKLFSADQFVESLTEASNTIYYVFVAKHTPFINDNNPPTPEDDERTTLFRIYKDLLYGKKVDAADVAFVIKKSEWVTNTVYDQYVHDENNFTKNFFVATPGSSDSYDVFKCISNNRGAPSTYYPRLSETSASDNFYETVDGYQWKYMYSITESQWEKFSTTNFMPAFTNSDVAGNTINGTIDFVQVTYSGSGYNMFTEGLVQDVVTIGVDQFITIEPNSSTTTDFYKNCAIRIGNELRIVAEYVVTGTLRRVKVDTPFTVTPTTSDFYYISPLISISGVCCGDGVGFKARALVNASAANSIYKVEIVDRGNNYTFANLVAVGGVTTVSNSATFKAIISPRNGHGFNPAKELGSKGCIISSKFDASLSGGKVINENDFRTIGLLRDPVFANVVIGITSSTGNFTLAETLTGANSGASGVIISSNTSVIRLSNVTGYFVTSETVTGAVSNTSATTTSVTQPTTYFDQTFKIAIDDVTGTFQEDEEIYQATGGTRASQNANGSLYFANSSLLLLTDTRGTFNISDDVVGSLQIAQGNSSGATAKVTGIISKDLVDYEGEVLYIENSTPITKNASQTETVRFILEF